MVVVASLIGAKGLGSGCSRGTYNMLMLVKVFLQVIAILFVALILR